MPDKTRTMASKAAVDLHDHLKRDMMTLFSLEKILAKKVHICINSPTHAPPFMRSSDLDENGRLSSCRVPMKKKFGELFLAGRYGRLGICPISQPFFLILNEYTLTCIAVLIFGISFFLDCGGDGIGHDLFLHSPHQPGAERREQVVSSRRSA